MNICTKCGNTIGDTSQFCPVCGTPVIPAGGAPDLQQPAGFQYQQPSPVQQSAGFQYQQPSPVQQSADFQYQPSPVQQPADVQYQQQTPDKPRRSSGSSHRKSSGRTGGSRGANRLPLIIIGGVAALIAVILIAVAVIKLVANKTGGSTKGKGSALTELLDATAATSYLGGGESSSDESSSAGDSGDEGDGSSGSTQSADGETPTGDGMVSEEDLQKGYVWLNEVKTNVFDTTYEELVDWFGVDGEFDKEDYSDTYNCKMRYYTWYSKDDNTHLIYVNLGEDDPENKPGVYSITGFNSNGWDTEEASKKYLDEVKSEAADKDKAAAANATMGETSFEIFPWGEKEGGVKVSLEMPDSGWSFDGKSEIVDNEDPDAFGAGFMEFKVEKEEAKFDTYKDSFENLKEIDDREIGGVKMKGRTYKYIGYEWTQYIGEYADGKVISIGIVDLDLSDGTMADKILNSVTFK